MKRVMLSLPVVVLLFALAITRPIPAVGGKGKPVTDTPVTVTIDGLGVNTSPTLRIQSDLAGVYRNSTSGQSVIQGIGDWELDMVNFSSTPQRKVLIDLRDPIPGSGPNGGAPINPFGATGYQLVRTRFIAKCTQNGIDFRTMQTNTPYFCPLAVSFQNDSGTQYRLAENPTNFAETNWVQVTCVATNLTSKCNQWQIEPSVTQLNGELKNVTKLLKVATRPNQSDQDMGDFYLSFRITLTNP